MTSSTRSLSSKIAGLALISVLATLVVTPAFAWSCDENRPPTPSKTSITINSTSGLTVNWTSPKWCGSGLSCFVHKPGQPPLTMGYYEVVVWNPATNQHFDKPRVRASADDGDPDAVGIDGLQPGTNYCAQVWGRSDASSGACRSSVPSNTACQATQPLPMSNAGQPIRQTGKPATTPAAAPAAALCPSGLVWRESFDGDTVCVPPAERDANRRRRGLAVR